MSDFTFTFDQAYAYFAYRLPMERLAKRDSVSAHCPFHADKNPSLSLNLAKGVWKCHACNEGGGILDFEKKMFPSEDTETAWKTICHIAGMEPPTQHSGHKIVATYDYVDAAGRLIYQKLRYEPKSFSQRQPIGEGRWRWNLEGVKKILYRLPELITSQMTVFVEGEKDADNLTAALAPYLEKHPKQRIACTTNFDGAGKWLPQYSPYFAGRHAVILPDNDVTGIAHAEKVAASIAEFAAAVKVVALPNLPEHGDVSDWLAAAGTVDQLLALVKQTPLWKPKETEHKLLVELNDFLETTPPNVEWLVQDVIPLHANGILVADPKIGKSIISIDLALAMASGSAWLGFTMPQHWRVGLISREDAPGETARRMASLRAGNLARAEYNWGQIWLNTRYQSPSFLLENIEQVDQLINELKMEQIDLAIFDVFRRLHNQDENDNTEMAKVLETLTRIQNEAGCALLLVHHLTKEQNSNVFRGARGASGIHGWAEWGVGLTVVDETQPRREWVRKVEFECKAACPADPVYFVVNGPNEALEINRTDAPAEKKHKPQRKAVAALAAGKSFYEPNEEEE